MPSNQMAFWFFLCNKVWWIRFLELETETGTIVWDNQTVQDIITSLVSKVQVDEISQRGTIGEGRGAIEVVD